MPNLSDEDRDLTAALALLTQEQAQEITGEPDELRKLLSGAQAALGMLWAGYKRHGLRQNNFTLKLSAQNLILVLHLVHSAYALGLLRGRAESTQGTGTQ